MNKEKADYGSIVVEAAKRNKKELYSRKLNKVDYDLDNCKNIFSNTNVTSEQISDKRNTIIYRIMNIIFRLDDEEPTVSDINKILLDIFGKLISKESFIFKSLISGTPIDIPDRNSILTSLLNKEGCAKLKKYIKDNTSCGILEIKCKDYEFIEILFDRLSKYIEQLTDDELAYIGKGVISANKNIFKLRNKTRRKDKKPDSCKEQVEVELEHPSEAENSEAENSEVEEDDLEEENL